jgi:hypothetical protein
MNIENVNKAIAVMERVRARGDRVDMRDWREYPFEYMQEPARSEEDLHTCGTAACFAGWVAVSSEWVEDGGTATRAGCPKMPGKSGVRAVADWLGMEYMECAFLCATTGAKAYASRLVYPKVAGVVVDIDAEQVLAALYRLRDTGTVYIKEPAQ